MFRSSQFNEGIMEIAEMIVENSFEISGRGIVLELRHHLKGLPKETELVEEKSGHIWKVEARVLFDHAVHLQRVFDNEYADFMLLRFEDKESRERSLHNIENKEAQNIYQYLLSPSGHNEKPESGTKLRINKEILPTT